MNKPKKPPVILQCASEPAKLLHFEVHVDHAVTHVEIGAAPELVEQLECGPYIAAERAVWREEYERWQRDDTAYRASWERERDRIRAEWRERCDAAKSQGFPDPPEPRDPAYDGPEMPTPVRSQRAVDDLQKGSLCLVLTDGSSPEPVLRLVGQIKGTPKIVTQGWEATIVVRIVDDPSNEELAERRKWIDTRLKAFRAQRDIEEWLREREEKAMLDGAMRGRLSDAEMVAAIDKALHADEVERGELLGAAP